MDGRAQIDSAKNQTAVLSNLLGSLELEVMEFMWQAGGATVRQVENIGEVLSLFEWRALPTLMDEDSRSSYCKSGIGCSLLEKVRAP